MPQEIIIKGDFICYSIAAASIIAKVTRDSIMDNYHYTYPQYNFRRHKGYPTKEHLEAIRIYGPCPIHRKTFRGVL
jgi:ribonuclease HII